MKDIKDYLHLYFGCPCQVIAHDGIPYSPDKLTASLYYEIINGKRFKTAKPILRPLSDITEEEEYHISEIKNLTAIGIFKPITGWQLNAMVTVYLLKQGFDLFNLIPEGLAIDKTKING